jgi:hypothetical protein
MSDDTEVTARADDADEGILDGLDTSGDETVEVIGEDITDENGASGARRSIGVTGAAAGARG